MAVHKLEKQVQAGAGPATTLIASGLVAADIERMINQAQQDSRRLALMHRELVDLQAVVSRLQAGAGVQLPTTASASSSADTKGRGWAVLEPAFTGLGNPPLQLSGMEPASSAEPGLQCVGKSRHHWINPKSVSIGYSPLRPQEGDWCQDCGALMLRDRILVPAAAPEPSPTSTSVRQDSSRSAGISGSAVAMSGSGSSDWDPHEHTWQEIAEHHAQEKHDD